MMLADDKWNRRFIELATTVANFSKDPSTKCGAVIVRPDKTIASIGYNGFPKSMPDVDALYFDRQEKYSRIVHAEMNALIHAREDVEGYHLITYPLLPCDRCVVHMLQAGIRFFVAPETPAHLLDRWGEALEKTKQYIELSGAFYKQLPK